MDTQKPETQNTEQKPFYQVIVHSFFVIPFLIAVFCLMLFAAMNLLTREKKTAYDYLDDVKTGGITKRWQSAFFLSKIEENKRFQGAFELSKILAHEKGLPNDPEFNQELIKAYKQSKHDDDRVRQYLALAMGRTEREEFVEPLLEGLSDEKAENISSTLYALGMLKSPKACKAISEFLNNPNSQLRSIAVVALGNIGDKEYVGAISKKLFDSEPNVQWGATLSLLQMGEYNNSDANQIALRLLNKNYLSQFPEVDLDERNNLMLNTIRSLNKTKDQEILSALKEISENDQNMILRSAALEVLNNNKI